LEARKEFVAEFAAAIVQNSRHYYAIPREGSRTSPEEYEQVMAGHGLKLRECRPEWMNVEYIARCYEVDENIYDAASLRTLIESRLQAAGILFEQRQFPPEMRGNYDFVVWATYGMGASRGVFAIAKYQVAEKILIELPQELRRLALVIVDGPFTAFDPYGDSQYSLFGSAKHTNHWTSADSAAAIPEIYGRRLNLASFTPVEDSRFELMREDCARAVPAAREAKYIGSRFTVRVVEDNPQDRRILYVQDGAAGEVHIFSGKVVSAVKAARLVCEKIESYG
jgi:hypothetical protein